MRPSLQIGFAVAIAALLGAGWNWYTGWSGAAGPTPPQIASPAATPVLVEALASAEHRVTINAIGTGEALKSAALYPSVSGEVVEVLFKAGESVPRGAPLIRLDDKHERLAVQLAEVTEREARQQLERLQKLSSSGTVTAVRLEAAQAAFDSARVRLAQAHAALEDRTVDAPFDGIMGLTRIDAGDRVTEDTLIAMIDDRSSLLVEFDVPEDYAGRIELGDPVLVRPWTVREREMSGTIVESDSRIDPTNRSLPVKARIPNPQNSIRPGTSFDVQVSFAGRSYPSVPEVAVLWSRDGAYLWRVSAGQAEKVFVTVVRRDRGRVLVEGPLSPGDLIVVEGVQGLRPGKAVEPSPLATERRS